ncbi:MAG: heparinase II/III domain-containing protein [Thermomicrobiales bacterium]
MNLLAEDEIARLRRRRAEPAFAAAWANLEARAHAALADDLPIPTGGAGWFHHYFCPDHSTQLTFDPARPHEHRCPVDDRVFTGPDFDAAWRVAAQWRIMGGMQAAGLVWQATGQPEYAAYVCDRLDSYAACYLNYAPHGIHAGQGRCMGTSLDEATWSIPIAWAYDAVRETLTPARRERIERQLLRPIGEHQLGQLWRKVHNIECWHLAGLATLGAALDEPRFLAPALDEQFGLPFQLREGVLDDGWWIEGSPSYHFYTLNALLALLIAARRRAPETLATPQLQAMLTTPLLLARGDLSLPALNDGWFDVAKPAGLGQYSACYERAWALWGNPAFATTLARLGAMGCPRRSEDALLFGPDLAGEAAASTPTPGLVQAPSGYAVLRQGAGRDERWLLSKYGRHGGGHAHPDKLHLDLHACGENLAPDPGSPGYSVPLHGVWFRHTLAHNTVLLGGELQPEAEGRLLHFRAPGDGPFGIADAAVTWPATPPDPPPAGGAWIKEPRVRYSPAYAGVTVRRCLLWRPVAQPYFLDLVLVDCPDPRLIDLAWHHTGAQRDPAPDTLPPIAWPTGPDAYGQLRDTHLLSGPAWQATWWTGMAGTRGWAHDPAGAQAIAARVPSNPTSETVALVLRRVTAAHACFATVYEPFTMQPAIRTVTWQECALATGGRLVLTVERDDGCETWVIAHTADALDPAPAGTALQHVLPPVDGEG